MNPLTDDQKKRLTLYLGECWHEVVWVKIIPWHDCQEKTLLTCSCGNEWCDLAHFEQNRTFDNYEDFGALKDKLVENGVWDAFDTFAFDSWIESEVKGTYSEWLFRPESCGLVAEYLKQKEGKDDMPQV
jgi:hypothetical protein